MSTPRTLEAVKDASHLYEVERRAYHLQRPGFRIAELQLSPTPCIMRKVSDALPPLVTRCGLLGAATKLSPGFRITSSLGSCRKSRIVPSTT